MTPAGRRYSRPGVRCGSGGLGHRKAEYPVYAARAMSTAAVGLVVHRWAAGQGFALAPAAAHPLADPRRHPRGLPRPGLRHHLLAPADQPLTLLGLLRTAWPHRTPACRSSWRSPGRACLPGRGARRRRPAAARSPRHEQPEVRLVRPQSRRAPLHVHKNVQSRASHPKSRASRSRGCPGRWGTGPLPVTPGLRLRPCAVSSGRPAGPDPAEACGAGRDRLTPGDDERTKRDGLRRPR